MMLVLLGVSAGLLLYVFAGYPLLLWAMVCLRGAKPVLRGNALPRVTLIISAYNEVASIREKLRNSLDIDYPKRLLEIVVVSDASNDGTDEAVREFAGEGVVLRRQEERRGKTAGLNAVVPTVSGEVVVFSDANAMYQPNAIRQLVRNFEDPEVGCVTGEARYLSGGTSAADAGERVYWDYEINIKRLETAVGSMVGGDGAIYAIRKQLWQTLPDNAINDFLNPLQIVADGWRAVYEPEAVCYEETAGGVKVEYRRRVRIVSRSWRALFQAPGVLNPLRVGFFTVSVLSHKVLRWLSGLLALGALLAGAAIVARAGSVVLMEIGIAGAVLAILALFVAPVRRLVQFGFYFLVITGASVIGMFKGTLGRVSGTWTTPRTGAGATAEPTFAPGVAVLTLTLVVAGGVGVVAVNMGFLAAMSALFWLSTATLAHVYLGYPLAISALSARVRRELPAEVFEPSVCLFIAANDEAAVMEAKLRNSLSLDYPRGKLRVVVASDGSVDGTNEIVRRFASAGVRLLAFPERRGKIAAINEGMTGVCEEIVIFTDANTFLERGAVRALVRNFGDPSVGAVSGDVILEGERAALGGSEDMYYRYERWLQACESRIGTMVGVDGALYALRRELFTAPPLDTILDDMAIPMAVTRAGRRVVFEPDARAHERGSETAYEEFARKSRVVAGAVQFLSRRDSAVPRRNRQLILTMVSHKALRWLSPMLALCAFITSAVLASQSTWFLTAALVQLAFMLAGLAGCVPVLRRFKPIGMAHYFWLVQAAAAVGFTRGLLGQQSVAWRRFQRAPVEVA